MTTDGDNRSNDRNNEQVDLNSQEYLAMELEFSRLPDEELESIKEDINVSAMEIYAASMVLSSRRRSKGFNKGRNPIEPM